jgi:hypothetical protein
MSTLKPTEESVGSDEIQKMKEEFERAITKLLIRRVNQRVRRLLILKRKLQSQHITPDLLGELSKFGVRWDAFPETS